MKTIIDSILPSLKSTGRSLTQLQQRRLLREVLPAEFLSEGMGRTGDLAAVFVHRDRDETRQKSGYFRLGQKSVSEIVANPDSVLHEPSWNQTELRTCSRSSDLPYGP